VNCSAVQEHAGDAIDRFLPKQIEQEFLAHLQICCKCRTAYELERLSKYVVQHRVKHISTPPSIQAFVVYTLREQYEASPSSAEGWLERLFARRAFIPALAGGLAVAGFVLFLSIPREPDDELTAHTASNDIINQSFKNLALVRSGQLKPALVSSYPESVTAFFKRNNIKFAVDVVKLANCEWYGAAASEYGGISLAHVVYKIGNDWMYVCQVCDDDVMKGSKLSLPPAAKTALGESGWYTDPAHPDCNVVVWRVNGTLCTAVSTMKKEKLLAMLTTR
jgi:hypothetical protein